MSGLKTSDIDSLSTEHRALLNQAIDALKLSYSPYSNYQVGAAVQMSDGKVFLGANVENASYGACICAERSALMSANAHGRRDVSTIAVIGRPRIAKYSPEDPVVPPCGICRQVVFEFQSISGKPITLILANSAVTKVTVCGIDDLLPGAFGPADMGIDVHPFRTA